MVCGRSVVVVATTKKTLNLNPKKTLNLDQILVKIVKAAQGRKVEGMRGEWKLFLKSQNGKASSVSHDPARHS